MANQIFKVVKWNDISDKSPFNEIVKPGEQFRIRHIEPIINAMAAHSPIPGYEFHHSIGVPMGLVFVFKRKSTFLERIFGFMIFDKK